MVGLTGWYSHMIGIAPSTFPSTALAYVPGGVTATRGVASSTPIPGQGTGTGAAPHPPGCTCASCSGLQSSQTTGNQPPGQDPNSDAIQKLKERDQDVRAHEAAHLAAAGGLAQGGAKFTYQRGPDGRLYATGGSVNIDVSPVPGDPKATIDKARVVRAAALAPSDPSSQDRAVAASAAQMAQQAQMELAQQSSQPCQSSPPTPSQTSAQTSAAGRRLHTALAAAGSGNTLSSAAVSVYA